MQEIVLNRQFRVTFTGAECERLLAVVSKGKAAPRKLVRARILAILGFEWLRPATPPRKGAFSEQRSAQDRAAGRRFLGGFEPFRAYATGDRRRGGPKPPTENLEQ